MSGRSRAKMGSPGPRQPRYCGREGDKAMTDLIIRKIGWEFDASVPFLWQPANPNFSNFCNAFTFIAVPFEKYIINAVRKAQHQFDKDEAIAAEAEAFLRQEPQHATAHRN